MLDHLHQEIESSCQPLHLALWTALRTTACQLKSPCMAAAATLCLLIKALGSTQIQISTSSSFAAALQAKHIYHCNSCNVKNSSQPSAMSCLAGCLPLSDCSHINRREACSSIFFERPWSAFPLAKMGLPVLMHEFSRAKRLGRYWPSALSVLGAGHEDSMSYTLEYLNRVNLKVLGKWSIPSRKTIKCGSRDIYERFIRSINRHIRDAGHQHSRQTDAGLDLANVSALTILDAPYETEEEQQQRPGGILNDAGCQ